ncbi:hypothetical protein ABTZ57_01195 [Streptomyces sp. NPDC094048]|uniref:hypothetical protein n=1 Tax=unclassified Streptomyces TaxID=2593676 RepID=UPI003331E556
MTDKKPLDREALAALIGDVQPASDALLLSFAESVRNCREHEHPRWEDIYCANLVAYMGERIAPVLRRLLDAEANREVGPAKKAELGEMIRCSAARCSFGEWSAEAAERGWVRRGDGWLCVQCADAADERAEIVARMPAIVELTDGTVTLTGWSLVELSPDYYGHSYIQIGGWLPKGWDPASIAHGTNHMVRAELPGIPDVAQGVNVEVHTKGYSGARRFMKIQWLHAKYPATWLDTLRETGKMPEPLSQHRPAPNPVDKLSYRAQQLLAHIRETASTRWTTGRAEKVYADLGYPKRGRRHHAREDLHALAARDLLTVHGPHDGRYFLLAQKDGA